MPIGSSWYRRLRSGIEGFSNQSFSYPRVSRLYLLVVERDSTDTSFLYLSSYPFCMRGIQMAGVTIGDRVA